MRMSMLELRDVSVSYGQKKIVENVSFSLEEGHWLMIIGPNGAGKTTLVKSIAQAVPYTGDVLLDGQNVRKLPPGQRALEIGILSQTHHIDYGFRVEEVVRMGRYAHERSSGNGLWGRRDPGGDAAVQRALERTGLKELASCSVLTLSGGEMQRMFFAQLLVQDPRILILDEPMNHLDPEYQMQLISLIRDWLEEGKEQDRKAGQNGRSRAVVSVMHDLTMARAYGDEALLLSKGHTAAYGSVREVLSRKTLAKVYHTDVIGWQKEMMEYFE